MNQDKYVFAQLVEFLNNDKFRRLVDKYDGNRYVKHFTCWSQLLAQCNNNIKIMRKYESEGKYTVRNLVKNKAILPPR